MLKPVLFIYIVVSINGYIFNIIRKNEGSR